MMVNPWILSYYVTNVYWPIINCQVLTQWALFPLGTDMKTKHYSQTLKCNKQPYDVTHKNARD